MLTGALNDMGLLVNGWMNSSDTECKSGLWASARCAERLEVLKLASGSPYSLSPTMGQPIHWSSIAVSVFPDVCFVKGIMGGGVL